MRVLILGARGQVGHALAETAPPAAAVTAMGRAECDVRSEQDVERAIAAAGPDLVFNAAAFTSVDEAETAVAEATAVYTQAPALIARAARAGGARTIHISTDYVFDGTEADPYRPGHPPNPLNVYGRTKLAGEEAVTRADPAALIVRTAWVYSGGGVNFVTNVLRLLRERERLQIVADQTGTPTRAQSLAAALWALAGADVAGVLHYRDSGSATRHEFVLAIRDQAHALGLLDRRIPIEPVAGAAWATPARRPAYSVLDASEAWRIIGAPPPDWRDNLRLTLEEIASR